MRLILTLFLHVYSQTGPPREVECRDSHQLFAVKDGGITLSAFLRCYYNKQSCRVVVNTISLMSKSNV